MNAELAATVARAQAALADGSSWRAVHHAHLRLPAGESVFATRNALEDALRSADFNDAGRLIVVRRLRLHGLPPQASGPQLARAIESAWRQLAPQARAFDAAEADDAPAVWFRSVHAARLAWLAAFVDGGAPLAWYWPRALPELAAVDDATAALAPLLAALQASAAPALGQMLAGLAPAAAQRLLAAMPAAPVDALVQPLPGMPDVAPASAAGAAPAAAPPAAAPVAATAYDAEATRAARGVDAVAVEPLLLALQPAWVVTDWRLRWFAALLRVARHGRWPSTVTLAQSLSAASAAAGAPSHATDAPPTPGSAGMTSPAVPRTALAATARQAEDRREPPVADQATVPSTEPPASPPPRPASAPPRACSTPWAPWLDDNLATHHGGLLMLLNVLEVLHYPAWLAPQPAVVQQAFTTALLARLAQRLRLPPDDPQRPLLALPSDAGQALALAACTPHGAHWPRGFDSTGLAPAPVSVAAALALWRRALARALRRHAGIGLAHVVARRGGVSITPTHVDVVLPLADVDLALRRAGLDRDPGWLPWFGRIVAFHYVDGAEGGDDGAA